MGWKYDNVGSQVPNPKAEPATPTTAGCACGVSSAYAHDYDALYCPSCYLWLERACGDRECAYCAGRPARAPRPVRPRIRAWRRT